MDVVVHLTRQRSLVLVTRIGEATHSGGARAAAILVDASSTFVNKIQPLVEEAVLGVRDVVEPQLMDVLSILLAPASLIAMVFGIWRLGADLGWTGAFVISGGFFSHWQVWLALAVALRLAASGLQFRMQARAKLSNKIES